MNNLDSENNKDNTFQFMLKEYEMLYSKFEMHYSAVEKTISLYFIIIGAVISANSFFMKDFLDFSIFSLSEFQILCSFLLFVLGSVNLFKIIEHRLLIITYVKNLNQNRKWFAKSFENNELAKYSLFKTSYKSPKFYKKYRHFYWEVLGIAMINSVFFSLPLISLFKTFNITSKYAQQINLSCFIVLSGLIVLFFMLWYKRRGEKMENDLLERGLED